MTKSTLDQLTSLLAHPETSEGIKLALTRSNGARYVRCALQVNPFAYLDRHSKPTEFSDESSYNAAMVASCISNDIDVVALTDHFRVDNSKSLAAALTDAGIHVFPGFEANSSDGIHLLCVFPHDSEWTELNLVIGACGVDDQSTESPQADKSALQIAELVNTRGGLTIAAHVCSSSGLLHTLKGQPRIKTWKSKHILAAAISGNPNETPERYRKMVLNKDHETKRERPMAVINANDVSSPAKLSDATASTLIKMSDISIEGLRQAFLDYESRIKLNFEVAASPHTEIIAVAWDGGLLEGQCLRLNQGLNVLIGGRGSGKSTVVESLRYAFDIPPRCDDAQRAHKAIVDNVVRPGTEISVLVHSPTPSPQYYLIKRVYGNPPRVFNEVAELLSNLKPMDVAGDIEIYGQHEISELTRQPEEIAEILRRFVVADSDEAEGQEDINQDLSLSARDIRAELENLDQLDRDLSVLPDLRERLKRFEGAGLDEKLSAKTCIDQETSIFQSLTTEIADVKLRARALVPDQLYEDILPEKYEEDLPNAEILQQLGFIQDRLINASERAKNYLDAIADQAELLSEQAKEPWLDIKAEAEKQYQSVLKELNKSGIDGTAYISVRDQIAQIAPKEKRRQASLEKINTLRTTRRTQLSTFETECARELRKLKKAAKKVGKQLQGKVRVEVKQGVDLSPLEQLIREHVQGQISQGITKLSELANLSTSSLADAVRKGADELQAKFGFSQSSAEKFASGGENLALEIEQHRLRPEAILSLNVGGSNFENWKTIDQLSTGQKATAVLLLLLMESDAPVIIDQPEDDLDNSFIVSSIVSAIRKEKRKRQFLFSSHNANIPVLGDAEQIIVLATSVEDGEEVVIVKPELCGSLDKPDVKTKVKLLLEGGDIAFEDRRERYGF